MREVVVKGFAWTVGGAGVIWGAIYVALGVAPAAIYPWAFSLLSVVNVLAHRRHGRFMVMAAVQTGLILVIPFLLAVHLGGLMASGIVSLWSLLGPIGALLVIGSQTAALCFVAFVALTAVAVWVDRLDVGWTTLPAGAVDVFVFLNVVGVAVIAFWGVRLFLATNARLTREQQRLRAVEQAYLSQEVMLRQQERLATLGKLSAGVAHELNNPAAAMGRATGQLAVVVGRLIENAADLMTSGVGAGGLDWVRSTADSAADDDPLSRGDREERLAQWLQQRSVAGAWDLSAPLASLGFDADSLTAASERYRERQVIAALHWIADVARANDLLGEVRTSTGRISEVVGALKGYSHMDRAGESTVDIESGIDDTLVVLRSKLTGIEVERRRHSSLPVVMGNAGELNQVWTNLIANAAEALDGRGTIRIESSENDGDVEVMVEDDGPGIPSDLVERVFDPFVTTKPPGEGVGLGLNLTHQIVVDRHGGSVTVESEPGCTRFVVRLPGRPERTARA